MKTLVTTTTGTMLNQMILDHCGDYAGKYQDQAFDIINEFETVEYKDNNWSDIMYNRKGEVFAIWAEDALTCQNAKLLYIQLERSDCEQAFIEAESKRFS